MTQNQTRLALLTPAGVWYAALLLMPLAVVLIFSFRERSAVFNTVNPWLESLIGLRLSMGYGSLIVILVRRRLEALDRALLEASSDLGASPLSTFRQITLPLITPAILAGFLLSSTFSFDDFIIAFFVAGPQTTLPIYVFSSIRQGVTPEINAIGTMVMAASLMLLIVAQVILQRGGSKRPKSE
ncbi:ABC transporter permease subunit [Breoghania sp.]|uniref:ABC transporter permease n=1 Tax=Breoghania sp. TaxID=2065378 RepID=UPI0026049DE7|nr:ABC transporter permease subunit [Breoghania sp.]MDJ0933124.1 ABC transporter permease subunit [Breoghania sp.]